MQGNTRRDFIAGGAAALAGSGLLLPDAAGAGVARSLVRLGRARAASAARPTPEQLAALRVLGRTTLRQAGSLPHPHLAAGKDTLPEIEHVVLLMMENHSYDNLFGMLGREPGQRPRGDGFRIAADGYPANSNPQANGKPLRAFRMPTTCQLKGKPSQEWKQAHIQYASGRNDGFVISQSGPVAMGYWDRRDLPFTCGLAMKFPIADRWFCSLLGQTDPNRRFLMAGTAMGMTDDIPDPSQDGPFGLTPPNGTIFKMLTKYGISWYEYASDTAVTGESGNLYPEDDYLLLKTHGKPFSQFLTDAADGKLPSFSFLDPNYSTQSQEDPQNIVVGETFLRAAVEAVGNSPKWRQTLMIVTYDEHGGYYDHVPPPVALAPDDVAPVVNPGESSYDGYRRYGFRVPSLLVGPYAKRDYVSHVVYDHTSVLAFLERKWNLPAMTLRDANANDLSDFLDLGALAQKRPTFPSFPSLPASGETKKTLACERTGPGKIPPPPPPKVAPVHVEILSARASRRRHGVIVRVRARGGTEQGVLLELRHRRRTLARRHVKRLGSRTDELVLRVRGKLPGAGRYEVVVLAGGRAVAERAVTVHRRGAGAHAV